MPFYKKNNEELLVVPESVEGAGVSLQASEYSTYEYPVEGWYWFNNIDEAMSFFAGLTPYNIITAVQARLILNQMNLRESVEQAILSNPTYRDYWEYSTVIERTHPIVVELSNIIGISSAQLDSMFIEASKL